jgi:hypothetical protein
LPPPRPRRLNLLFGLQRDTIMHQELLHAFAADCPYCGAKSVRIGVGLHGLEEFMCCLFLCLLGLIPGIIYYVATEGTPRCSSCGRRIRIPLRKAQSLAPAPDKMPPTPSCEGQSVEGRLARLKQLRASGVITEQEYIARRQRIINEL